MWKSPFWFSESSNFINCISEIYLIVFIRKQLFPYRNICLPFFQMIVYGSIACAQVEVLYKSIVLLLIISIYTHTILNTIYFLELKIIFTNKIVYNQNISLIVPLFLSHVFFFFIFEKRTTFIEKYTLYNVYKRDSMSQLTIQHKNMMFIKSGTWIIKYVFLNNIESLHLY